MAEGFEQARDLITHNASFQVACQRYAHGSGSSEAIAAAALRVLDIYPIPNRAATPTPVTPDLIRGKASLCNDCGTKADCDKATELCFDCFCLTFPAAGEEDFQP